MAKIRKQKSRDLSNKKLKNTDTPGTQITLFKIFFIPLRQIYCLYLNCTGPISAVGDILF